MSKEYYNERYERNMTELSDKLFPALPPFAIDFFIKIRNDGKSSMTQVQYARDILGFLSYAVTLPLFSGKTVTGLEVTDLEKIRPKHIEYYMAGLRTGTGSRKTRNSDATVARHICALRSFFHYYYRTEAITYNPAELVDVPRVKKKEIIRLDAGETADILDAAETGDRLTERERKFHEKNGIRDTAILTVLLGTGMRVSELVGLDINDYDTRNGCFHIIRKGGKEDAVYYGEEVEKAMQDYVEIRRKNTGTPALFLSNRGTRMTVRNVEYMAKKYGNLVTTKNVHPHTFRKSFGSELYRESGDIYLVAAVLGHESVNTTKASYAAMPEEIKRGAASKVHLREEK